MKRLTIALIILLALAGAAWAIWAYAPVAAANRCVDGIQAEIRTHQREHRRADPWELGPMTQIDSPAGDIITRQAVTFYPPEGAPVVVEFVCVGAAGPLVIGEMPE